MPSWKKVITSGSSAMLSSLYTSGDVSGSASSIGSFGQVKAGTLSVTGNITTQGDIIAENYIVSSSVTYMTQSYSSGSTVFGNTSNDKHQFTGSLSTTLTGSFGHLQVGDVEIRQGTNLNFGAQLFGEEQYDNFNGARTYTNVFAYNGSTLRANVALWDNIPTAANLVVGDVIAIQSGQSYSGDYIGRYLVTSITNSSGYSTNWWDIGVTNIDSYASNPITPNTDNVTGYSFTRMYYVDVPEITTNTGISGSVTSTGSFGSIYAAGNVIPTTDATVNLGSDTKRFANLYTADIQLSNEQKGPNDIDGTTGKWTIQEGKNDLFLINRRTGEKFKFIIEQVE